MRSIAVLSALLALVVATGGAAAQSPSPGAPAASPGDAGSVVMFSSQLNPVEEQEKMRTTILAGFGGQVEFVGAADTGAFIDRVRAEAAAGPGEVGVLGGLHGEFSSLAADGLLADVSDLASELTDVTPEFMELGILGSEQQQYIPWMQATYIMAARSEALEYLPEGADINALTWEQLTEWGANMTEATGERLLGFPGGEDGLLHRFFQGYSYPAFTGGVNTTFATPEAVAMWDWLKDTWQYVNPQSTTYGFMQEPLQSGEVWVAWDHTARLIAALQADPESMVAFPVPAGPAGRAYMPVVAGLAIPNTAPNPDGARALIRFLLEPATQGLTLQQVSFFPVLTTPVEVELDAGIQAEQEAVAAQTGASDALPALLPVGLGDQGGAYNQVFRDAFTQIVIEGGDSTAVVSALAPTLQGVLDAVSAPCWEPDPVTEGTCQVGNTVGQ
jgi:multiple sugar transport system substrate-binding protein